MISLLRIEKFLLIQNLTVEFSRGLNVVSGETGTGKSMTIYSIEFVMGKPGDYEEGTAVEMEVEGEKGPIILRREVSGSRSRYYIDGRGASQRAVQEVLEEVVSLQGQNEFIKILKHEFQRDLIDRVGNLTPLRKEVEELYDRYTSLKKDYDELSSKLEKLKREKDFIEFRIREVEELGVSPSDLEELKEKAQKARHVEKIREKLSSALFSLYEGDKSAYSLVGSALRDLEEISYLDPSYREAVGDIEKIKEKIYEVYSSLSEAEFDISPQEVDRINEILFQVQELERKYGKEYREVVEETQMLKKELEEIDNLERNLEDLGFEKERALQSLRQSAEKLSGERKRMAPEIETKMADALSRMGLESATVRLKIEERDIKRHGKDFVEILFSSHGGEPKPLSETASGGELSRLFLALALLNPPSGTYIFDEVDAGISGETSLKVAKLLREVARRMQVIVITHSSALCAAGDRNLKTEKTVEGGVARVRVKVLSEDEKVQEVARLMGAKTRSTLEGAKELIKMVRE